MEAIRIESFCFSYPNATTPALQEIDGTIEAGECVLLCGMSGSGKSTLLSQCIPAIAPHGARTGNIFVNGQRVTPGEYLPGVGYVGSDPERQLVTDTVYAELAFGLESIGATPQTTQRRIAEISHFFGMSSWLHQPVSRLSGGQKQLVNLAAALCQSPRMLLLDEPTAKLDPLACQTFLQQVHRVHRELGMTIFLSEHRLEEVLPLCDRVLFLQEGRIKIDAPPQRFLQQIASVEAAFVGALPAATRLAMQQGEHEDFPIHIQEGRAYLRAHRDKIGALAGDPPQKQPTTEKILTAKQLWFCYEKGQPMVLQQADFSLMAGEMHAILGSNGSGKSTLLSLLAGAQKPLRGKVQLKKGKTVALLPQEPQALFACSTVWQELLEWQPRAGYEEQDAKRLVEIFSLQHCLAAHPYDLSGGEMQRVALCKLLLLQPDILLLDEPTFGLDVFAVAALQEYLQRMKAQGMTICAATHDLEFAASFDRCSMMFDGAVIAAAPPDEFFCTNEYYTTAFYRLTRGLWGERGEGNEDAR